MTKNTITLLSLVFVLIMSFIVIDSTAAECVNTADGQKCFSITYAAKEIATGGASIGWSNSNCTGRVGLWFSGGKREFSATRDIADGLANFHGIGHPNHLKAVALCDTSDGGNIMIPIERDF